MNTVAIAMFVLISLSVLVACGDSGSSTEFDDPSDPVDDADLDGSPQPNADEQSGEGANGGLVGRIITTYNQKPVQFDLFTGQMLELPVDTIQNWLSRNGQNESDSFASADSYFGATGAPATQFVQTVPQCIRDEDRVADFESCVAIYGANLQKQEQFNIPDIELTLPAKLSPSGRYLAANEFQYRYGRTSEILLMNVAEKTIIDRFNIDTGESGPRWVNAGDSPLAWTPADALVYTVPSDDRVVIYITEPGSLDVARSIRLPASYQGEVITLDVSPDGSKLLMGYDPGTGLSRSGVLLLDLDTLQISVPAIVASEADIVPLGDNINGNIRTPTWSPDGRWILVMEGTRLISDAIVVLTTSTRIFAVPASQSRTLLTSDSPTNAILIRVEYPDKLGEVIDNWSADIFYEADLDWVE